MPRKAIVAGVFLCGLLLAGCEWCGNCKGMAGKGTAVPYASAPPRTAGATAGNPIIYNHNLQTPSAQAANPSGNRFMTATGAGDSKSGIVPAAGSSVDPNWARKPNESWGGSAGVTPAGGFGTRAPTVDSEVPAPEDPEVRNPADAGPSLQRPERPTPPGTRPEY